MSHDNGDFDFLWGEMTPRDPMGREEFDKLYDEAMERTNAFQIERETAMELERLAQMEQPVLMCAPRCGGKSHLTLMLRMEAIAEAAEKAQTIFVVTDECLAKNPQLEEIALQFGGKIITSEKMPQAIDCIDELTHTLRKAQPKAQQLGRGLRPLGEGRTSKGDRRRKRQQWRNKS